MSFRSRIAIWLLAGLAALLADVLTKAIPHSLVVDNYSQTPALVLVAVALFLGAMTLARSKLVALGAGLMFGALCGNGGQLLVQGYVSDWLPLGGWLTNVADLLGGLGLLFCFGGYLQGLRALRD